MFFGLIMLLVLYILYLLLVKGALWKLILAFFGWIGLYIFLAQFPGCREYPLHNDAITWAALIPTVVVLLAMLSTKEE